MDESIRDWLGNDIYVGSHVVYPGRQSSDIWLTESLVVGFPEDRPDHVKVLVRCRRRMYGKTEYFYYPRHTLVSRRLVTKVP